MVVILDKSHIVEYFQLKQLGYSDAKVAEELLVSHATLARWKRKHKVIYNPRTIRSYLKLREEGCNDAEISLRWGVSTSAVYQWKVRNKIPKEYFRYELS